MNKQRPGADIAERISRYNKIAGGQRRAVSIDEACAMLSVGRTKIKALIRDKELRAFKIGIMTRIPITSIDAYIEKHMQE